MTEDDGPDRATLILRSEKVAVISTALRAVPQWREAGETQRNAAAGRIAFARYLVMQGGLSDGQV